MSFPNACKNNVTAANSQIGVDMNANAPLSVAPGDSVILSDIEQALAVPGGIFVVGYNLGILTLGGNTIPATVQSMIAATNTVEGSQATNISPSSISTTISDPDTEPGTGDEMATDGTLNVTYDDQTWTAGTDPATIEFREETVDPISPGSGGTGGAVITATVGGVIEVVFACSPGTVSGPDPGTIAFDDPAVAFAETAILVDACAEAEAALERAEAKLTKAKKAVKKAKKAVKKAKKSGSSSKLKKAKQALKAATKKADKAEDAVAAAEDKVAEVCP